MGGGRGWNLRSERMDGEKMGELEERGGMGGEEGGGNWRIDRREEEKRLGAEGGRYVRM